ncbi:MAG: Maf family protein, partial [Acidimicrobiia bacterium]|nr:Maf family protein [Acidimicrobiia bacterium]
MTRLILASGSPRRRELLGHTGLTFVVVIPDVDESV